MSERPDLSGWAKVAASIVAAAVTAFVTAHQATDDKVGQEKFDHVTVVNCQAINDLQDNMRAFIEDARIPGTNDALINGGLKRFQTKDCSRLESRPIE